MNTFLVLLLFGTSELEIKDDPNWQALPVAIEEAKAEHKPVLIYIHAPWCGPCLKMEKDVFPEVAPLLERFALAGLDYDDNESAVTASGSTRSPLSWAMHYGAETTPTFVLLAPDGTVVTQLSGYVEARGFSILLAYVATKAYNHVSFEDYAASIQK